MQPLKQQSRCFAHSSCSTAGACIRPNRPAYLHASIHHPRKSISTSDCRPSQSYRRYGQSFLTKTAAAVQSCRRSARGRSSTVATKAYLHSDASHSSSSGQSVPGQLRVLVVGANPVGLAAAVALAQTAGCAVEVHDSRVDPREDKHADYNSTLVALGKRGLDAVSQINLPPPSSGGRAVATITTGSPTTPNSNAANSSSTNTSSIAGLWGPGSANLGVPPTPVRGGTASSTSGGTGAEAAGQGLSEMEALSPDPLPGLTLLQGMVVLGAGAARREEYSRTASRSKPKSEGATVTGGMTAGVAAIDELALTARFLAAAATLASTTAYASQPSSHPQLVLPGAQAAGALNNTITSNSGQGSSQKPTGQVLSPKGTTAIPKGPALAPSAEAAQEAALPPVVPTQGTGSKPTTTAMGADLAAGEGRPSRAGEACNGDVEVHFNSHLTLFDAANKQATFMGPGGAAIIVPYDLCIAADAAGGGHLVLSALKGLQDRQEAHKHPSSAHHSNSSAGVTGVSELEYRAWHDMPQDPGLAAVLSAGASKTSSTGLGVSSTTPQQGWLLVWTGPGNVQAAHPGLSSAGSSSTSIIPGAPTCTIMAWPSKGGATWSGCVFTHPQVFEALRNQSDYEQFLGSVSAPAGRNGSMAKLPALWVQGIAAQLKRNSRVGSVPAAVTPPPHSLSAPSIGLVALSTAAVPSNSPQLLNPGISLGLAEASSLAAALSAQLQDEAAGKTAGNRAGADGVAERAEGLRKAVQEGLKQFDAQHGPEAQALHKLTAQLSWLRHPFSPAAAAAAASVPFGTLAWIFTALGAPRTGLALQWKCLLAVLPIVAAVQRVLLYKLGLGRADTVAAARSSRSGALDASYRKPAAVGASTSLDSGVHVTESAQAQKESAALSALAGFNSQTPGSNKQGSANPAYSLSGVADAVEPCGKSFLSFLHTTDMPPTGIWRLLQVAPLIMSVLWGALFWAAGQAIKWGMWAFRAWGWAQSGVA